MATPFRAPTAHEPHAPLPQRPHTPLPVSPALLKAAEAAWSRYASTCCYAGTTSERQGAYQAAREAERRVWIAEGSGAARA